MSQTSMKAAHAEYPDPIKDHLEDGTFPYPFGDVFFHFVMTH
jgi:hypothetical protein